ncbi:chitin deacetylase [Alkalihalophilus pseudofirmus]|nr:chitin deacetylase [Alkalihalophilus pseudofirmus]
MIKGEPRMNVRLAVLTLLFLLPTSSSYGLDKNPVTVLMYHHFDEDPTKASSAVIHPETFREQLLTLKEAGYTSIPERDFYDHLYNGKELPALPLVITIDDGYVSNYEFAYPILKELEIYATIYVVTSYRGEKPGWNEHFSWEQAREMKESGWIEIQGHTHNGHGDIATGKKDGPFLVTVAAEETKELYQERIYKDLTEAKQLLEKEIDNEFYSFAFPFGLYNKEVVGFAEDIGYELMYTVKPGRTFSYQNPHTIKRLNASGEYSGEELLKAVKSLP